MSVRPAANSIRARPEPLGLQVAAHADLCVVDTRSGELSAVGVDEYVGSFPQLWGSAVVGLVEHTWRIERDGRVERLQHPDWRLDTPQVSDDGDLLYGVATARRDDQRDRAAVSLAIAQTSSSDSVGGSLVLRALPDDARSAHFVSRDVGYATGSGRVYATIDQARSWHPVPMRNLPDGTCAACNLLVEIGGPDRSAWQRAALTLF